MRIHTSLLSETDMRQCAAVAGVRFARFAIHGSRSRSHAFEIVLTGSSSYRTQASGCEDDYAATWDEWGIFLGEIFRRDYGAHATYYASAEEFHWMTGDRFRGLTCGEQHKRHKFYPNGQSLTGSYHVSSCECGALRRFMASGRKFSELAA